MCSFLLYYMYKNRKKSVCGSTFNLSDFLVAKCNQPSNLNDILVTDQCPIDGILRMEKYVTLCMEIRIDYADACFGL